MLNTSSGNTLLPTSKIFGAKFKTAAKVIFYQNAALFN